MEGYRKTSAGKRRSGSGSRPVGAGGRTSGSYGRRARQNRRRKRLLKAAAAWLLCIFLVAAIAAGTFRLIGYVTSSKKRQLRRDGIEKLESGEYAQAIEAFDQALEKSGKRSAVFNSDVLKYRAEAELRLGDYEAAVHTYDLLSEMDKESALSCQYLKSICYAKAGNMAKALSVFQEAQSQDKAGAWADGREQALKAVGHACMKAGEYEQAMALYQSALEGGTENEEIYNQMGLCQMAEEDYDGAFDSFDKGYETLVLRYSAGTGADPAQAASVIPEEDGAGLVLLKELAYNRAVACEYLQQYQKALELFEDWEEAFGPDDRAEHEIAFLRSR